MSSFISKYFLQNLIPPFHTSVLATVPIPTKEWEGSGGNLNGALLERHWTLTELILTVGTVGTAEVGLHVQNFGCRPPILNDW